jgi:hypothetical protein
LPPVSSQDNTLYYLQGAPQRYFINPASQPECNFFIGTPGLSSSYFRLNSSGFASDQLLRNDPEIDSLYFVYQRPDYLNDFISKLDKVNYLSADYANNLISFGFRANKMYFTFDIGLKTTEKFAYPRDLLKFIFPDNTDDAYYDMSSLNIDFTAYSEIALGISRQINEQLSIGIRPKILFGLATLNSAGTDISIIKGQREWVLNTKSNLNVCVPGIIMSTDKNGVIDLNGDFETDSSLNSTSDYINMAFGNKGYGIDAGINYKPFRRLELSASLIDFGYIKWKKYTHTVSLDGEYKWEGVQVNSKDSVKFWDYIKDTLKSSFKVTGSDQGFKTYLTSKVYFGGRFFLTPAFDVGAISRFEFFKKDISSNITLLADWRPSTVFGISVSYGLLDGSYSTFGLGLTSRVGPCNFYIVTDDIPTTYNVIKKGNSSILILNKMYSYNLRFGFNLVFGNNKIKKLLKDKPMYYSTEY